MIRYKDEWWVPNKMGETGPGSYVGRSRHVESALSHHTGPKRVAVQAGGHIGIWPKLLADHFDAVYTFEANFENWECAARNAAGGRVFAVFGALGERNEMGAINVHEKSTGGHHMATWDNRPQQPVPVFALDHILPVYVRGNVDTIFLDIEGYELHALRGAMETIALTKPTLVIEENGCSKKFGGAEGDIEKMLAPLGYRKVAAYDEDIVLTARES